MILLPAVPITRLPFVAVIFPKVAVIEVPALTWPAVASILPVVAVTPVPPVTVVVAARVVVVVRDPGAVMAAGRVKVTVAPDAAVVIWLAVPAILILLPTGVAVPVSPVNVERSVVPPPRATHVDDPPERDARP
jgi:hypothetical protein